MLFNIDSDSGARIEGWIMPDNPSAAPSVLVVIGGEVAATVKAHILRPLLREQGLHETGLCGFIIDTKNCPQIDGASSIEIYDSDTNVRIYRRRPASADIDAKLFRLEGQLLRNALFNEAVEQHFHMAFTRLDSIPEETAKAILGITFSPSIYVTGRVHYRVFEPLLRDRGFKICAYLRDPVEEMAEQLLLLRLAASRPRATLKGVLPDSFLDLVASIDPDMTGTIGELEAWLLRLSPSARQTLSDPLARLLTCLSPEERAGPQAVADALDTLAEFAAVGFHADMKTFASHLGVGLDVAFPKLPSAAPAKRITDLAAELNELGVVHQMLAADREIYQAAWEAYQTAYEDSAARR
jgi:hypothetical protein